MISRLPHTRKEGLLKDLSANLPQRKRAHGPFSRPDRSSGKSKKEQERSPNRRLRRHVPSGRVADASAQPRLAGDARAIQMRVQALGDEQLLERFHELVDKRLAETIQYPEVLELDLISARLDAENMAESQRTAAVRDDWRRERNELVASIERLLARLTKSH